MYVCTVIKKETGGEWLLLLIPTMEQMASVPPSRENVLVNSSLFLQKVTY